jgi:hypothetical protein
MPAIFGFGTTGDINFGYVSITNLVNNSGVVAADQTALTGTARAGLAAAGYGYDKAIFGFGIGGPLSVSITNLVNNLGVVATDTAGVGTPRFGLAAAGYGTDKAIFGYGFDDFAFSEVSITNLVNNLGVVATDTTGVGTPRLNLAAAGYGGDKAIFGFGGDYNATIYYSLTNLVNNLGVVAADTTGVGTGRDSLAAAGYGGDKAIFGYGYNDPTFYSLTNLVTNLGVVATDTTGVGTARAGLAAAGYGGDKAIFGYGAVIIGPSYTSVSVTNLVNNLGVVAADVTGVGTARNALAAASYDVSATTTTTTAAPGTTTTTTAGPSPSGVGAIFGFGADASSAYLSTTNLVSATGVVAADVTSVGTGRFGLAAASYGGDKAIFGFGTAVLLFVPLQDCNITNLVNNLGVVATDNSGVGTARGGLAAAGYGGDKAIFGFGEINSSGYTPVNMTNLVTNTGVVATDQSALTGTARYQLAAAGYGGDKAIFGFGQDFYPGTVFSITNLVDNLGVVVADQTALTGTARQGLAAAGYGGDKAIFGFGSNSSGYTTVNITNLVNNLGVVATDTTGVGTARWGLAAAGYGGDKAIFGFGYTGSSYTNITNLVSNTGVVVADQTALTGTARSALAGASLGSAVTPTTTTTTAGPPPPPGTTTTTTSAPTTNSYLLTNIGTEGLTLQSMIFYDPLNIGHTANLINLGGSSAETGNATLSYNFPAGTTQTFTLDYFNIAAGGGTYYGNVVINGSDNTRQVIGSVITVPTRTEPCDTVVSYDGGLTFPSEFIVNLGANTAGTVTFTYNAFSIPDRFVVIHNGAIQVDTGYVGDPSYLGQLNSTLPSYPPSYTTAGVTIYNTYPVSSIGPNNFTTGISFNKILGVSTATVLVFAPISGTYWQCKLTCAALPTTTSTTTAAPGPSPPGCVIEGATLIGLNTPITSGVASITGRTSGSTVWGDNVYGYTTDSDFGKAAVHAGLLTNGQTGNIQFTNLGSQPGPFPGTTQNGVTTSPWPTSWCAVTLSLAAGTTTTTTTTAAPPSGTVEFVGTLNPSPGVGAYGLVNDQSNNIGPGEVRLTFTPFGTVTVFSACLSGVPGTIVDDEMYNTWFTPSGGSPGLSYDIRISAVSGAVPARTSFSDFTGVPVTNQTNPPPFSSAWFPLSSNQSVSVYLNSNSLGTSHIALTITFEIALAGTGVSIYSGTGQLRMGDEAP